MEEYYLFLLHGLTSAAVGLLTGAIALGLVDRVLFRGFNTSEEIKNGNRLVAAIYVAVIVCCTAFAVCVRW